MEDCAFNEGSHPGDSAQEQALHGCSGKPRNDGLEDGFARLPLNYGGVYFIFTTNLNTSNFNEPEAGIALHHFIKA